MEENKCEFCDSKVIEEQLIYASKYALIVYPRNPLSKGHLMILTKRHANSFSDIKDEEILEIKSLIDKTADIFINDGDYGGFNLINNSGSAAGQHIKHFHLHIFLRSSNEEYSPLDVLSKKITRKEFTREEWKERLSALRKEYQDKILA